MQLIINFKKYMRKIEEILEEKVTALDKYNYTVFGSAMSSEDQEETDYEETDYKEIENIKCCKKFLKEVEKKYGKKNLGPYTDYEFGKLEGRLETLRWVLGEDWEKMNT